MRDTETHGMCDELTDEAISTHSDEQQFSEMKLYVISPFLLCLVSAVPLYLLNLIHIIVHYKNKNWGHPVHSIVSFSHHTALHIH